MDKNKKTKDLCSNLFYGHYRVTANTNPVFHPLYTSYSFSKFIATTLKPLKEEAAEMF